MKYSKAILSNLMRFFVQSGKVRYRFQVPARNYKTIWLKFPSSVVGERFYLPHDEELDNSDIKGIEIPNQTDLNYLDPIGGSPLENLTNDQFKKLHFTLAKDSKIIAEMPCTELSRSNQEGNYTYFDSKKGRHRIGDCFLTLVDAESVVNRWVAIKVWYNEHN